MRAATNRAIAEHGCVSRANRRNILNSIVLFSAEVGPDRLVSSLKGALPAPSVINLITDQSTWTAAAAGEVVDLVMEEPLAGDFPTQVSLYGDPARWAFMIDTRAFYQLLDRWVRAVGVSLVVLDGPGPYVAKRFAGAGVWEWVEFDSGALDSADEDVLRLVNNGCGGVITDARAAHFADLLEKPLGPHDLTHSV
jgi:hypothetical protein